MQKVLILATGFLLVGCDLKFDDVTEQEIDGQLKRLTNNQWKQSDPAWSPDGSLIAYSMRVTASLLIKHSLNDEESDAAGRVESDIRNTKFDLSPDGAKVVYAFDGILWLADLQEGTEKPLTDSSLFAKEPAWSPAGDWIAFSGRKKTDKERRYFEPLDIYTIPADGGEPQRQTFSDSYAEHPSWSPDGTKIAYQGLGHFYRTSIFILDIENRENSRLGPDSTNNFYPDWSPDGSKIAYYSETENEAAIWIIPISGEMPTKLTKNVDEARNPAWSPDGFKIAFSTPGGIGVVSTEGELLRLTSVHGKYPVWFPDGNAIVRIDSVDYAIIQVLSCYDAKVITGTRPVDFQEDLHPSWFPDNNTIAFSRANKRLGSAAIWAISISGGQARQLEVSIFSRTLNNPAVSPDGRLLAYDSEGALVITPLSKDSARMIKRSLTEPAWSPDGKGLICKSSCGLTIIPFDAAESENEFAISGCFSNPAWSAVHPDFGSQIAAEDYDGIYVMTPEGLNADLIIECSMMPTWSPDGTTLAYVNRNDYQLYTLCVSPVLDGRNCFQIGNQLAN